MSLKIRSRQVLRKLSRILQKPPLIGPLVRTAATKFGHSTEFHDSTSYWESRYSQGGNSGYGSYGKFAQFKASVLNNFVQQKNVCSVVEFGCGDGNQLSLADYPEYTGVDISPSAIRMCKERFGQDTSKNFILYNPDKFEGEHRLFKADLALSLDVIFHLIEDDIFEAYMRHLFRAAERFVIIYSSDTDTTTPGVAPHFRNRRFSPWIKAHAPEWRFAEQIQNPYVYQEPGVGSVANFFIYHRKSYEFCRPW